MFLLLAQLPPPVHGAAVINKMSIDLIMSMHPGSTHINTSSASRIEDVGRPSFRKFLKIASLFIRIIVQLTNRNTRYCYINLHPTGMVFFRDSAFCLLAKAFRKNVILHLHGRGIPNSSRFRRLIYKLTFNNTYVIHLSPLFFDEVSSFVAPDRFTPIPNCSGDLGHLIKAPSSKRIQFYYLSNYMRGKGALELLNTAKRIYQPDINCQFILAGDWFDADFKTEIEQWTSDNSLLFEQGYIQVLGPVQGVAKDELIKESDVFIFPSYIDTFPLVVLEAMSAGKMVISTATGATPEILAGGEAGILVPERDHLALAEKILQVIQNPGMIEVFSKAARNRYLSTYTEEHFKSALSEAIKKITST